MKKYIIFILICSVPQILLASTAINGLRVWTGPEDTKAVIDLSDQVDYKLFQLNNPPRVVVDIEKTHIAKKLNLKDNPVIKKIRNGIGPVFIEFSTYRWLEHCGPNYDNDIGYRSIVEFEKL